MGAPRLPETSKLNAYRNKAGEIVDNRWVHVLVTGLLLLTGLLMGIEVRFLFSLVMFWRERANSDVLKQQTLDFVRNNTDLNAKFGYVDTVILVIFTIEFCMEWFYLGWKTLRNAWLVFDGSIALLSWALISSPVKILKSFRIFRIFALVSRFTSLKVIFSAVVKSLPKMVAVRYHRSKT
jgi:hypothetical protein